MQAVHVDEYHRQLAHPLKVGGLLIVGVSGPVLQPRGGILEADNPQAPLGLDKVASVHENLVHAVQRQYAVPQIQQRKPEPNHRGIVVAQQTAQGAVEGEKQQQEKIPADKYPQLHIQQHHKHQRNDNHPQCGKAVVAPQQDIARKQHQQQNKADQLHRQGILPPPPHQQADKQGDCAGQGGQEHTVGALVEVHHAHHQKQGNGEDGDVLCLAPTLLLPVFPNLLLRPEQVGKE